MRQQDREAYDVFVRAHLPRLLAVGRALTNNERAGADLVQEALERALLRWSRIKDDAPEDEVVRLMMRRRRPLLDRLRRAPLGPLPAPSDLPPAPTLAEEDVDELLAAVHRRTRHRRQGRIGVIAAGVLAVLTTTGVIPSPGGVPDREPGERPTGPAPTSTASNGG